MQKSTRRGSGTIAIRRRLSLGELPGGIYKLNFELPGFTTMVRDDLRLAIGFTARVDVAMADGGLYNLNSARTATFRWRDP